MKRAKKKPARKQLAKRKAINPHAPAKVAALEALGAEVSVADPATLAPPPPRQPTLQERAAALGLVGLPAAPGSAFTVWAVKGNGIMNDAQRSFAAERVLEQKDRGAYVKVERREQTTTPLTKEELDEMARKLNPDVAAIQKQFGLKPVEERMADLEKKHGANGSLTAPAEETATPRKGKRQAAKPAAKEEPAQPAKRNANVGGAVKVAPKASTEVDPNQKFVVVKDNTRSGHMKTFMAAAAGLKRFTRAQLVGATQTKVTKERAERYFDYCLYKKLIGEAP